MNRGKGSYINLLNISIEQYSDDENDDPDDEPWIKTSCNGYLYSSHRYVGSF